MVGLQTTVSACLFCPQRLLSRHRYYNNPFNSFNVMESIQSRQLQVRQCDEHNNNFNDYYNNSFFT